MDIADPTARGRLARILLWLWLASDAAMAAGRALMIVAINDLAAMANVADPDGIVALADMIGGVTSLVFIALFVATVIAVGMWTWRVSANAHAVSDAMTISPGWAVGWYFIPIANLFKPYQALRETWQVTFSPDDPWDAPVPGAMRLWWGLWIVTSILGNLSFQISMRMANLEGLEISAWIDIISLLVDIPLVIAFTAVIAQLSAAQARLTDIQAFE